MNILMPNIPDMRVSQTLQKRIPNPHQSVFQFPPQYAPCCVLHLKTPPRFYERHHLRYGQVFSLKWTDNIRITREGCESRQYEVFVENYASYSQVNLSIIWRESDLHTSDGFPLSNRLFLRELSHFMIG